MPRSFSFSICLLLLLLVFPAVSFSARGKLTGSAELMFAGQTSATAGVKTLDASHFVQQYSLLWTKQDKISNGRLGRYNITLGYDWRWVDSEINGNKVAIENPLDKLLYRGEITLAPGGLPFRMHAFSYDMHQTTFNSVDLGLLFANDEQSTSRRGIVNNINNGTHITTGVRLEAGVSNGHYQGQYRDLLANLPRFMIDYKQRVVQDVKGPNPLDYVDRDLAFVSLNKKNNWIHYRRFEHEDKINADQNNSENSFMLGTIDQTDRRQWVNLTNWINVSADISYTESDYSPNLAATADSTRYDINLFAKATRTRWQLDNFTSYSRIGTHNRLEHTLHVPFYSRGELNRDTHWRFQLEANRYATDQISSLETENSDGLYMRGQLDTFRQARYIMRPMLELETKSGSKGQGQSARLGMELFSSSQYRSETDIFAGYSALYSTGSGVNEPNVSFTEHVLTMRMEDRLSSLWRVGIGEEIIYGSGRYDNTVADRIGAVLSTTGILDGGAQAFGDSLIKSVTSAFADLVLPSGLRNHFEANYELLESDTLSGSQLSLSHRLDYARNGMSINFLNNYVDGSGLSGSNLDSSSGVAALIDSSSTNGDDFSNSFSSALRFNYAPGRSSNFNLQLEYEGSHYKVNGSVERSSVEQTYEYTFWHNRGRIRKLLVLGETVEYSKGEGVANEPEGLLVYSVFSSYYPTSKTLLSARLRYEKTDLDDTETLLTFLSAGVDFSKFQASVDYSYGRRPETSTSSEVLEHKWEVTVKKTF